MACGIVLPLICPVHVVLFQCTVLIPRTCLATQTVTFNIGLETDKE